MTQPTNLSYSNPEQPLHTAQIINRGEVVATLKDATEEAVKARANRLCQMQRWSRAEVVHYAP